ncbi:DUF4031 domain-containing protein [Paraburkholderia hospita]|uniref:DUF4031 domain-containing protein n=1 Tax=Paraburkholderia hospita TaxID=169430 RepID=UPI000B34353D|nr:DUF4031 domain-containing protein [Paraburkholderia hospita]OUL79913.1 hypothetical protein CA603_33075 [Paraburkholderia hospita]
MTVYVDDMRAKFGRMVMCHMIADTDEELHAMAAKIGVARRWWQAPPKHSHYDIALSKRALAVDAGTIEITWRQAGAMCARRRATGELGSPTDAIEWQRRLLSEKRVVSAGSESRTIQPSASGIPLSDRQ